MRVARSRIAARAAAVGAVTAFAAVLAGCQAPRYETNWNRLRAGLGRDEVESLLGHPSSTYAPPPPDPARPDRAPVVRMERWQYGDTLSSMATRAMFPDEADERAWCVFFGADGRVSGFRPPSWAADRRSMEPVPLRAEPPARPGAAD